MKKGIYLLIISFSFHLYGEKTCKKCEILRKYHEENPCPYQYYEDYLKAVEEKKETPKKVDPQKLLKEQQQPSQPANP